MAFKPTEAQLQAITQEGNVLVSAAAGSGKTAVLVERVISKLCNEDNPVRADELLIVTFTNAAAAEMRSRIESRLDEECRKNPDNIGILLQKHLMSNAKICTIDSFCIDLVRENFNKLNVSCDFKISDSNSLKTINEQVLYNIINGYIEEKNQTFYELMDIVGAEYDESNFANLVLDVYDYSRQLPFPEEWFESLLNCMDSGEFSNKNLWYEYAFSSAQRYLVMMQSMISNALEIITANEKSQTAYLKVFSSAHEQIDNLYNGINTGDWNDFYNILCNVKFDRLPSVRGLSELPMIDTAKDIYKFLSTKSLETLKKFFFADFDFINNQFKKLYSPLKLFIEILKEFDNELFLEYNKQNVFTFHNTEHLALKLLCKRVNGKITANDDAIELLNQYKEIMVDEYQDTNDLQNMLFYVLSNFEEKLFVVGDVKQSIYAFRGANPLNFIKKKNFAVDYKTAEENQPKKIILGNNFRCKSEVCDFINYFFELFMQSETGDISYGIEEKLIPSAVFPETNNTSVSFDIIDCKDANEKSVVLEARQIAKFITDTINGEPCIKQDDNTLRNANFGDFTILLRSVASVAPGLVLELRKQGIPVNLSINNFANSFEISTFLSLLKVIDNPQSDVELLTVMMSPIFCFSADEMAQIRSRKRDGNLYSAVILSAKNNNKHAIEFLEKIENYRLNSVTLPLPKLISKLLINTDFLNIVSALSDGQQRRNNLLLLSDLAEQFVDNNMFSLSEFVKFVHKQAERITSVGGVDDSDTVKIMSIHASKGLQFPICIIASASSRFNDSETRNPAVFSTKYGIGFKYFDEQDKQKYTTLAREVILDEVKQNSLQEELRLLYVAMTRTQDKLHFISSFKNFEKSLQNYKSILLSSKCKVDYGLFSRTKSYSDWLLISLILHPQGKLLRNGLENFTIVNSDSKIKINIVDGASLVESKMVMQNQGFDCCESLIESLIENFEYEYPYRYLEKIHSKMSVSVLTNKAESDKYSFTSKPNFLSENGISASGRGTAMHKVMEFFDFDKYDNIESEIERLYEWQFITEEERNSLNVSELKKFFASDIFARIKKSSVKKREMRFLTELPVEKIDTSLKNYNETVIVQGAVDICFVEDDGLVILDFKTDRVEDIEDLAKAYGEQLAVYAIACEKIFGLKVKEKIIYSFSKSDTVVIK